jgi:hypothetical protein
MDQLLYLLASLAGVAAMVGFCVLLFGRGSARIDAASVEERLRADVPGFRSGDMALAADAQSALVEDAHDGALFLVTARGARLVTRKLSRSFVRKAHRDGAVLDLLFSDFTFPKTKIVLAEEKLARDWEARVARLAA